MVDNLSRTQLFASNSSRLLPSTDLVWQSITPAVQSQQDQLVLCSLRQENRFCSEEDEGAPAVLFAHGLPNLCRSKAASSLGQKAPTFWRINGSKCHVRVITTMSWYFLWRRHNEIIKSFHRTGYAISSDVIKLNGANGSAQGYHASTSIKEQYKTVGVWAACFKGPYLGYGININQMSTCHIQENTSASTEWVRFQNSNMHSRNFMIREVLNSLGKFCLSAWEFWRLELCLLHTPKAPRSTDITRASKSRRLQTRLIQVGLPRWWM